MVKEFNFLKNIMILLLFFIIFTAISPPAKAASEKMNVSIILPLSGQNKEFGKTHFISMNHALNNIDNPLINYNFYNSNSSIQGTVKALQQSLIDKNNLVIGAFNRYDLYYIKKLLPHNMTVINILDNYVGNYKNDINDNIIFFSMSPKKQINHFISNMLKKETIMAAILPNNKFGATLAKEIDTIYQNDPNIIYSKNIFTDNQENLDTIYQYMQHANREYHQEYNDKKLELDPNYNNTEINPNDNNLEINPNDNNLEINTNDYLEIDPNDNYIITQFLLILTSQELAKNKNLLKNLREKLPINYINNLDILIIQDSQTYISSDELEQINRNNQQVSIYSVLPEKDNIEDFFKYMNNYYQLPMSMSNVISHDAIYIAEGIYQSLYSQGESYKYYTIYDLLNTGYYIPFTSDLNKFYIHDYSKNPTYKLQIYKLASNYYPNT